MPVLQPGVIGSAAAARALIADLAALATRGYPFVVTKDEISKRPFAIPGAALLSGAISTVESISFLSEQEREGDCNSLLRDLVDRAILFSWLAADPAERVALWERQDMRQRLAMDNAVKRFGSTILDADWRKELEDRVRASENSRLPTIEQLASEADLYWADRLLFSRQVVADGKVFGMLYAGVFRYLSGFTHAAPASVYALVEDTPQHRVVVLEATSGPQRAVSFAPLAFALILFVNSEVLGWPASGEIFAVISKHAEAMRANG